MPTPVVRSLRQPIHPAIAALAILLAAGCDRSSPAPTPPPPPSANYANPIVHVDRTQMTRADLDALTTWSYTTVPLIAANDDEPFSRIDPLIERIAALGVARAKLGASSVNFLTRGPTGASAPTISLPVKPFTPKADDPPDQPIVIRLLNLGNGDVSIQVEGIPTPPAGFSELHAMLASLIASPANPAAPFRSTDPVIIRPDPQVAWVKCIAAVDAAQQAGLTKITLGRAADRYGTTFLIE